MTPSNRIRIFTAILWVPLAFALAVVTDSVRSRSHPDLSPAIALLGFACAMLGAMMFALLVRRIVATSKLSESRVFRLIGKVVSHDQLYQAQLRRQLIVGRSKPDLIFVKVRQSDDLDLGDCLVLQFKHSASAATSPLSIVAQTRISNISAKNDMLILSQALNAYSQELANLSIKRAGGSPLGRLGNRGETAFVEQFAQKEISCPA